MVGAVDRPEAADVDAGAHHLGHAGARCREPLSPRRAALYPLVGLAVVRRHPVLGDQLVRLGGRQAGLARASSCWPASPSASSCTARACASRAPFREPFMTAEGDMTKAVILALAVGIPVAALIFQTEADRPLHRPSRRRFWLGSLLGGVVFGIGMVFAGGCGTGSLWRMGEGHLEAVGGGVLLRLDRLDRQRPAQARPGWTVSEMNLDDAARTARVGFQAYLPDMLDGWGWTLPGRAAPCCCCGMLLVRYNESTGKFTLS
ncbi:MAG: YeeE/YedE family protein [Chromatiales bacterium]|nr:YeeE/YedE family protein [Chromatiales bacterium]